MKSSKIEGPSTRLSFLGIIIDTSNMQASISEERKQNLSSLLYIIIQMPPEVHKAAASFSHRKVVIYMQGCSLWQNISKMIN